MGNRRRGVSMCVSMLACFKLACVSYFSCANVVVVVVVEQHSVQF